MAIEKAVFARPYAKALFGWAQEQDCLSATEEQLQVAMLIVTDPDGAAYIRSPQYTAAQKLDLLVSLKPGLFDINIETFLALLVRFERLLILPEILKMFHALKQAAEGALSVEVISAKPLDSASKEQFKQTLSEKLASVVDLECQTEPSLLGGAIIKSGDWVVDGSVRGRLNKLAETLI